MRNEHGRRKHGDLGPAGNGVVSADLEPEAALGAVASYPHDAESSFRILLDFATLMRRAEPVELHDGLSRDDASHSRLNFDRLTSCDARGRLDEKLRLFRPFV